MGFGILILLLTLVLVVLAVVRLKQRRETPGDMTPPDSAHDDTRRP